MSKNKWISTIATSAIVASSLVPAAVSAEDKSFTDLQPGDSHYEAVMALTNAGIINGYPDGSYKPNQALNKKQTATLFVKALQLPDAALQDDFPFEDINPDTILGGFLQSLLKAGIIEPSSTYNAGADLTREEMASWLAEAFDLTADNPDPSKIGDLDQIESEHRDDVLALYEHGITRGKPDGTYDPKAPVTRAQFATFLYKTMNLSGIDQVEEVEDFSMTTGDRVELPEELNVLLDDGTVVTANVNWDLSTFDGSTAGEYTVEGSLEDSLVTTSVTITVNALEINDVKQPEDISIVEGQNITLPDELEADTSEGSKMIEVLWDQSSLDTNTPGSYTITGTVAGYDETIDINVDVERAQLEVAEVKGINLRQIQISFNQNVEDYTKLANKYLYSLEDENEQPITISAVDVKEDHVTLTTDKALNQGFGLLQLHEDITGDEEHVAVQFVDTEVPELTNIEMVSPRKIALHFSEPMDVEAENGEEITNSDIEDAFDVDTTNARIDEIHAFDFGKTLEITFSRDLEEEEHTLTIDEDEVRDYFGFKLDEEEYKFNAEFDKSAPEIEKLVRAYPNMVTVRFNKPIEISDDEPEEHVSNLNGDEPSRVFVSNRNELTIMFDEENGFEDQDMLEVDAGLVEDAWGNENNKITQAIVLDSDSQAPTITNVELIDQEDTRSSYIQLKVTTSEPVKSSSVIEEQTSVLNDDGDEFTIKDVEADKENDLQQDYIVTLDERYGQFKESEYTLYFEDLEDLYGNKNKEASYLFEASSMEGPGNFTGFALSSRDQEIVFGVNFDREMETSGAQSIEELSNYEVTFDGTSYSLSTLDRKDGISISLHTYEDGRQAQIVAQYEDYADEKYRTFFENIEEALEDEDTDEIQLIIGKVADNKGIPTSSFYNPVTLEDKTTFGIDEANVMAEDTIEIHLADEIRNLDDDDFILFADEDHDGRYDDDDDEEIPFKAEYDAEDGKTTVTLTIPDDYKLDTGGKYDGDKLYITSSNETNTENKFGQLLDFDMVTVGDGIAPKIVEEDGTQQISIHPMRYEDNKAVIQIPFTEDMDERTISRLSFQLDSSDYEVEDALVDDETVQLIVDLDQDQAGDLVGEFINQVAPIADENDNLIENLEVKIEYLGDELYIKED